MTIQEPQLAHLQVHEVMHTGMLTTDPGTPLRVVARLMAAQHVHAVAIADPDHARRPLGIVTSLDVVTAAAGGEEISAGQAVSGEVVTVLASDSVDHAAGMMAEHGILHLMVIDPATGYPAGILSSLDVASAYAS